MTLFGEPIRVAAEIETLPGISGHADREGLLAWAAGLKEKPEKVFVVHGEDKVTEIFADLLKEQLGYDAYAPYSGTEWDLLTNTCIKETVGIPYVKKDAEGKPVVSTGGARAASVYNRLESAAERLLSLVRASKGLPNKEIARFADQVTSLVDKWSSH